MKVEISPRLYPHRGGSVLVGNVYQGKPNQRHFRLVVSIVEREDQRPWNNVVCLSIDAFGKIVGASCQPYAYIQDHQDLIGRCTDMPNLKIEWLREQDRVE